MNYVLIFLSVLLLVLSFRYRLRFAKIKDSGKIPDIIQAKRNTALYFVLAVVAVFVFIFVNQDILG